MRPTFQIARVSVLVLAVLSAGCRERRALPGRIEVQMTGSAYRWEIRHAGWDAEFGTADDVVTHRRLQVPLGIPVRIHLRSDDFIYGVSLPDFGQAGIGVPGLENAIEFVPAQAGEFAVRGNQLCGFTHPELMVALQVVGVEEFVRVLDAEAPGP